VLEHRYPAIINFPGGPRPRGLGYASIGHTLGGLGTWVVTAEWGRGNSFQPGHPALFPKAAFPTSYPRAQAARVLGPSAFAPLVARPFPATRLPTMRHPVRATPITAAGATLRNPGVNGFGDLNVLGTSLAYAVKTPGVFGPALGGVTIGVGARIAGLTGTTKNVAGLASLALVGWSAWNLWRAYKAVEHEVETSGAAAAGARVGASVAAVAIQTVGASTTTDSQKRQILQSYSCYENARRTDTWWGRMRGTARNPLVDCGLTADQAEQVKLAFSAISRTDRVRLMPGTFGPGGPLADLG